ncbi:MAG: serine/threonine protein kinase, partial [Cyanobacteria bacterium]|nr:serine/threonine protein kinase [Cyanobacteriota bacterium]
MPKKNRFRPGKTELVRLVSEADSLPCIVKVESELEESETPVVLRLETDSECCALLVSDVASLSKEEPAGSELNPSDAGRTDASDSEAGQGASLADTYPEPPVVSSMSNDAGSFDSPVRSIEESDSNSLYAPFPQKAAQQLQHFGAYELVWEICRDALSTTWATKRDGIEQTLALRIFNSRFTDSAQVRNIQKAASKASELTHPNHVTVYENGVGENGAPYVVSDWVEGDTLAETFQVSKRLDIAGFLNIFNQVCEALIEAHSHLLVHGNLSPNKIILVHQDIDVDQVKLIDFGMPVDPVQNAFYLSPEQCLDRNQVSERSDIFSLGCIMYEALVGSPPFIGDKVSQASTNYLHELANQYGKDTPEHNALKLLDCIIIKCLQKKPSKRFRNVRELMDALRLVSDCICNGSRKKLPPKAEKLLLFRFLDFFDRKIVFCLSSYLILGMVSLKYIGELQLQKSIDAAQLAVLTDSRVAATSWKEALHQAQLLNKPPGLQADLHWELANSLRKQFSDSHSSASEQDAFSNGNLS